VIRNRTNIETVVVLSLVLALGAWAASAQSPAENSAEPGSVVATVGNRRVTRAAYENAARRALADYIRLRGSEPGPDLEKLIRRQTLERLMRTELLAAEALRRGIPVTEAEIDAEFRTHPFFNKSGTFSPERFQRVKAANSPEYRSTVDQIRGEIAGRKLAERVEREQTPDAAALRAEVERSLSRATLEYLALRVSEFDGSYPEPTEAEVLDYYRTHEKDLARSERAELTVIQVGDASSDRSRATADSLLAQLRQGMTFEGVSAALGGRRSKVQVSPSEFPSWWPATPAAKAALFGTRHTAGTVLPQVFPGRDGWLIARVDAFYPAGVAPLRDVSREIRRMLREEHARRSREYEMRVLYEGRKSMLRTTAYRVRYAVFDTTTLGPANPSGSDIEAYYRRHLADFSAYDPATAKIRTRTLAEVRDDVKARWRRDERVERSRITAARLEQAWRGGRRDRALESQAVLLRDRGPMPLGVPADTSYFGSIMGDSLTARGGALGTGVAILPRGTLVFHVHQMIRDFVPSFEEYLPALSNEQNAKRAEQEEAGARARYDRDPQRYAGGKALYYTELVVPYLAAIDVRLTRREVERYHVDHIDRYSASEQVRARHILVSPDTIGPAADEAARRKAQDLLQRLRGGEDFAELARRYSDDPPTRAKGGDLGFFGRGVMLDAFERAAFALKVGETSEPVRTEAGWHIIRVIDQLPLVAEPLSHVYANVGSDAASEKAERMAMASADSLLAIVHTPARLRAIAKRKNYELLRREVAFNEFETITPSLRPLLRTLSAMEPGQVVGSGRPVKGLGVLIAWLDSIAPARNADWPSVRTRVIDEYRHARAIETLYAKRAELDSLAAVGFGLDSIAALWGGFERITDAAPGKGIVGLGGAERVDSLVFGGARSAGLAVGQTSDWVELTRGIARIRLAERVPPGLDAVAARTESQRRLKLERGLQGYFARLSQTHTVRILDPELREIPLPPLPDSAP
jgi:hypothetical protein